MRERVEDGGKRSATREPADGDKACVRRGAVRCSFPVQILEVLMENRLTRRTVIAGALVAPLIGVGVTGVFAKNQMDKSTATPGSSPEASPNASPGASPMASPSASSNEVMLAAEDIKYDKTELKIPANTDVKVTLENKGMLQHDWAVDELKVMIDILDAGEKGSVTVNADAGEYEYYCTVPGHKEAGMVGKLIVG